jgi:hypothetical protein
MDIDVRDPTEQAVRCRAVGIDRDADRLMVAVRPEPLPRGKCFEGHLDGGLAFIFRAELACREALLGAGSPGRLSEPFQSMAIHPFSIKVTVAETDPFPLAFAHLERDSVTVPAQQESITGHVAVDAA